MITYLHFKHKNAFSYIRLVHINQKINIFFKDIKGNIYERIQVVIEVYKTKYPYT